MKTTYKFLPIQVLDVLLKQAEQCRAVLAEKCYGQSEWSERDLRNLHVCESRIDALKEAIEVRSAEDRLDI